jgi:microcystin degradation protein MlrC
MLEANAFAPVADEAEFREKIWLEGDGLLADVRGPAPCDPGGLKGFVDVMDRAGPWQPVPIAITSAGASGPADQGFFEAFLARLAEGLKAALPVDGVYIEAHGAASATAMSIPRALCSPWCVRSSALTCLSSRPSTCTPMCRRAWWRKPIC